MQMIAAALDDFLAKRSISRVHFANAGHPPPDLAYLVNFPRISITLRGVDRMDLEQQGSSRLMEIRAGEAVAIPPNCWNRPHWTEPSTVVNVLVGKKQLGMSLTLHNGKGPSPALARKAVVSSGIDSAERHLVDALLAAGSRPSSSACPAILNALLHSLRDALAHPARAAGGKSAAAHEAIAVYLQQNFAFPLTRESVAAHFHLSPGHVSRLFRREGLVGFNEYLNRVRIDRAKFLLRNHPLTLDEIAARCGYADAAYFCRMFKRLAGTTPTAYRLRS